MDIPFLDIDAEPRSFLIRPLRRQVDPVSMNEPPHRHNYQELMWIKKGNGRHRIDQHLLEIQPDTFYLIAQGQVHYFEEGVDLEGYLIRFTDDFLLDTVDEVSWDYRMTLFSHFAIHQSLTLSPEQSDVYERHLARMWREQCNDAFGSQMVLRHLLGMLLIRLERTRREFVPEETAVSPHAEIYQAFLTHLEKDFKQNPTVGYYAKKLHITPRQLSDTAVRFSGKTAKQLIQQRRMLEAKRFLQHTNASVKEISFTLSFRDPSYFSKAFKQAVGVSPHAYKANL